MDSETTPTRSRTRWWIALAALLAALAFLPALRYGFVFDEQVLITDNPAVHNLGRLDLILGEKFWPGPSRGIYYRPLVTLSYALGYAAAGNNPWGYHLVNLILHVGATVLFFFLARRLSGREDVAVVTALLFAVHPIHLESVAWVPGRTDTMAAGFVAGAFLLLLRGREAGRRAWGWLAAGGAVFLLALGAKEVAITLPALLLLHDLHRSGREPWRHKRDYLLLAVLAAAFLAFRAHVLSEPGPEPAPAALAGLAWPSRLPVMAEIPALAALKILWPLPWRIDYAYADFLLAAPAATKVLLLLVFLGLVAAAGHAIWKHSQFTLPVGLFLLTMLPTMHLAPFPTLFAERFLYLPSFFLILFLVQAGMKTMAKKRRTGMVVVAAIVGFMLAQTVASGRVFRDDLVFWQAAVRQTPNLAAARNWLGIAFRNRHDPDRAEAQYRAAIRLDPALYIAEINLAEIMLSRGDVEGAARVLEPLVWDNPGNPDLRVNLGIVCLRQGRKDEARRQWEEALRSDPRHFMAHLLLARYYFQSGDRAAALPHLEAASRKQPDHPLVRELSNH